MTSTFINYVEALCDGVAINLRKIEPGPAATTIARLGFPLAQNRVAKFE